MKINSLVVKVASLCNLNCTYCYVYNMGDNSYKLQPKFMSDETIKNIFIRIKQHCNSNKLDDFLVIFHGGEPLLCGVDFFKRFVTIGKDIIDSGITISYSMQTNGVLLTKDIALKLKELDIQVGISLDGTKISNNTNRIYHNGKGAYDDIINGFNIIKDVFGKEFANCLCVIDTSQDPKDVYNHFKSIGVSNVSLLLQDVNYVQNDFENIPKIGNWLSVIYDIWYNDEDTSKPNISPLEELMAMLFNVEKSNEVFGKGYNGVLVIETNGAIEPVDTLKICGDGFTKTNFNVSKDSFDNFLKSNIIAQKYYKAHKDVSDICKKCPVESICGGGFIGHRYSKINEFNNPTIYCKEIIELISYLQNKIVESMPSDVISERNVEKLNASEIISYLYEV